MSEFRFIEPRRLLAAGAVAGSLLTITACGPVFNEERPASVVSSATPLPSPSDGVQEALPTETASAIPTGIDLAQEARDTISAALKAKNLDDPYSGGEGDKNMVLPPLTKQAQAAPITQSAVDVLQTYYGADFKAAGADFEQVAGSIAGSGNFVDVTDVFNVDPNVGAESQAGAFLPDDVVLFVRDSPEATTGIVAITDGIEGDSAYQPFTQVETGGGAQERSLDVLIESGRIANIMVPKPVAPDAPEEAIKQTTDIPLPPQSKPVPVRGTPAEKYRAVVHNRTAKAYKIIADRIKENNDLPAKERQTLAIASDLDNTAFNNLYRKGKANVPILQLHRWAKKYGVKFIANTARNVRDQPTSARQLQAAGYDQLYVCSRDVKIHSVTKSKEYCLERAKERGLTIIYWLENTRSNLVDGKGGRNKLYENYVLLPKRFDGKKLN